VARGVPRKLEVARDPDSAREDALLGTAQTTGIVVHRTRYVGVWSDIALIQVVTRALLSFEVLESHRHRLRPGPMRSVLFLRAEKDASAVRQLADFLKALADGDPGLLLGRLGRVVRCYIVVPAVLLADLRGRRDVVAYHALVEAAVEEHAGLRIGAHVSACGRNQR